MRTAKKILLIVAIASIVAGLLLCFGAFAMMGFRLAGLNMMTLETHSYTVDEPFTNLFIDGAECDVRLRPSEDGSCKVVCKESDKIDHTVRVVDGTLTVERVDHRRWYEHIFGFYWGSMEITIYLPESAYASLSVTSVSGNVEIPADFSFAEAKVQSTSGDVRFLASVENGLSVKTVSGDLSVRNTTPRNLHAQATSGDVSITSVHVEGELAVKTVSGDLALSQITCGSVDAETTSGDVDASSLLASGNLRIKTVSGDVDLRSCDAENLWIKTTSGDVSGKLLTEKFFVTDTTSGRVRVPQSQSGGKCEVTTTSGDISFTVEG